MTTVVRQGDNYLVKAGRRVLRLSRQQALGLARALATDGARPRTPPELRALSARLGMDEAQPQPRDHIQEMLSKLGAYLEEHVDHEAFGECIRAIEALKDAYAKKLDDHEHALNRSLNATGDSDDSDDQPPKFNGRPNRGGEPEPVSGSPMLQASDAALLRGGTFEQAMEARAARPRPPVSVTHEQALDAFARRNVARSSPDFDSMYPGARRIGQAI